MKVFLSLLRLCDLICHPLVTVQQLCFTSRVAFSYSFKYFKIRMHNCALFTKYAHSSRLSFYKANVWSLWWKAKHPQHQKLQLCVNYIAVTDWMIITDIRMAAVVRRQVKPLISMDKVGNAKQCNFSSGKTIHHSSGNTILISSRVRPKSVCCPFTRRGTGTSPTCARLDEWLVSWWDPKRAILFFRISTCQGMRMIAEQFSGIAFLEWLLQYFTYEKLKFIILWPCQVFKSSQCPLQTGVMV